MPNAWRCRDWGHEKSLTAMPKTYEAYEGSKGPCMLFSQASRVTIKLLDALRSYFLFFSNFVVTGQSIGFLGARAKTPPRYRVFREYFSPRRSQLQAVLPASDVYLFLLPLSTRLDLGDEGDQ